MKIEQKVEFVPVVITLETAEEMSAFWDLITNDTLALNKDARIMAIRMSDMISNTIHL